MRHFIQPETPGNAQRARILDVLGAARAAVDPAEAIRRVLVRGEHTLWIDGIAYDLRRYRRIFVIGGGKAGASMAGAIETLIGDLITAGVVNVKYGYAVPTEIIAVREASHPVPDEAGIAGTREMVGLLRGMTAEDLVLCLISGGGSALMTLPVEGVSLDDLQTLTNSAPDPAAPIQAVNAVRKHLSQSKAGSWRGWPILRRLGR
jgi:glycerate-2-kinase